MLNSYQLWRRGGVAGALVAGLLALAVPGGARAELKVLATIKPIHALAAQVMGATGTPGLLVGGTASPHTFSMKPSDAKKLAGADVVFQVSETIEPFMKKARRMLPKGAMLVTLQHAAGVVSLPQRDGGPFEDHDHGDAKGAQKGHDSSGHGEIDGHVWLDPNNAKAMIDAIADVLGGKAPEQAATYKANATAAKARIDAMAADLRRDLAPVAGRPYVVFHDAYQYFETRFGMTVVGSITVNPEIPPSGKRLAALRQKITSLGAACVFGEPNFEGKVIATVVEGTRAKTGTLDPEGSALSEGPDLYDTLMRTLAASLKACLQPST